MTFEAFRSGDGSYKWRLRNEDGTVVKRPRLGHIHLPSDPAREERSRKAVQAALAELAERPAQQVGLD